MHKHYEYNIITGSKQLLYTALLIVLQYNTVECFLNTPTVYYTTELTAAVNNHGSSICPFPDAHPSSVGTTVWNRL